MHLLLLCAFPFHPFCSPRRQGVQRDLCPNIQLQTAQPGLHQRSAPPANTATMKLFLTCHYWLPAHLRACGQWLPRASASLVPGVPGHGTGVLWPPDTSPGSFEPWTACLELQPELNLALWFSTLGCCLYFWRAFTDAQLDLPKAQIFSVLNLCLPVGNSVWQAYLLLKDFYTTVTFSFC